MYSQNIKKHQWKKRVVLIFSEKKDTDAYQEQIKILSESIEELNERKIVLYSFSENQYRVGFSERWLSSDRNLNRYNKDVHQFKIVLIGLDGSIKWQQYNVIASEKLFAIIDGMPMRRRELRKNK